MTALPAPVHSMKSLGLPAGSSPYLGGEVDLGLDDHDLPGHALAVPRRPRHARRRPSARNSGAPRRTGSGLRSPRDRDGDVARRRARAEASQRIGGRRREEVPGPARSPGRSACRPRRAAEERHAPHELVDIERLWQRRRCRNVSRDIVDTCHSLTTMIGGWSTGAAPVPGCELLAILAEPREELRSSRCARPLSVGQTEPCRQRDLSSPWRRPGGNARFATASSPESGIEAKKTAHDVQGRVVTAQRRSLIRTWTTDWTFLAQSLSSTSLAF